MNPLASLLPALIALLNAPPLQYDGAEVGAFEHLPSNNAGHYVLLQQPTAVGAGGSAACRRWSCTALVDVVTQFPTDLVSSEPAETLATQVASRVEGRRLTLPVGYDCGPATLDLHSELRESDGELLAVRRLLRYRWDVFYSTPLTDMPLTPAPSVETGPKVFSWPFTNQQNVRIRHNLGRHVVVDIYDEDGDAIEGTVNTIDLNTIEVVFSQPLSGTVVLR